ncbi:MAG TPA: GNAT family N-acetyltransferase [Parafilimonas sp.]|nr:GNAT family N-acetyltransferase [Parafilimonas sp.]
MQNHKHLFRKKLFDFPDINPFENFSFEKLNKENFQQLYLMFEADDSPFTDHRFKTYADAKEYADYLEDYGAYLPKHGSQDWFFLRKNNYAGILHLYDRSLETFAQNNQRCRIGFATRPGLRNIGLTKTVLRYFIRYIFNDYPIINYIHAMTMPENLSSQRFLSAVGFEEDFTERVSKEHKFYLMERAG